MGSGKTTILGEASDILTMHDVPHAGIDVDALSIMHLRGAGSQFRNYDRNDGRDDVMFRNLRDVWENYASRGITRIILARALETLAELELCRRAVPAEQTIVCRLRASVATMQERVRRREPGTLQQTFVERVSHLNSILDNAQLEEFSVVNEQRPVADVAREMLLRAGWLG